MQLETKNLDIVNASFAEVDPLLDMALTAFSQAKTLYQLANLIESLVWFRKVVSVARRLQNRLFEVEC